MINVSFVVAPVASADHQIQDFPWAIHRQHCLCPQPSVGGSQPLKGHSMPS